MIATAMSRTLTQRNSGSFSTEDDRWHAVAERDRLADGRFVYAVKTTGIYCRPSCASRRPRRENVLYFVSPILAEASGFRACRKCRPREAWSPHHKLMLRACRHIESAVVSPSLAETAAHVGLSPAHFHRLFSGTVGVTPKAYANFVRERRLRSQLSRRRSITEAIYSSGFESSSRLYSNVDKTLGMSPGRFRDGGRGLTIRYAVSKSRLGLLLVAATDVGLCMIEFGDSEGELRQLAADRFHAATLTAGDKTFRNWVRRVVACVDAPTGEFQLPLDIQGTAFQCQVWQALQAIPVGTTATYREIAQRIGRPSAVRAVANACAANPLAVAIPCHRVIRSDGDPGGYKWGKNRKAALREAERAESHVRPKRV